MDLNSATIAELIAELDFGVAYEIELWRPFASWEDLSQAPGLEPEVVLRLRLRGDTLGRVAETCGGAG